MKNRTLAVRLKLNYFLNYKAALLPAPPFLFVDSTPEVKNIGILGNIRSMVAMTILLQMTPMIGMEHHQRFAPPAFLGDRIQLFEPLNDPIQRSQCFCALWSMGVLRIVIA